MAEQKVIKVHPYQVRAAKLAIQLAEDQGREPSRLMRRIAAAKPAPKEATASSSSA